MNNEITRRSLSLGLPLSLGLFQLAAHFVAAEKASNWQGTCVAGMLARAGIGRMGRVLASGGCWLGISGRLQLGLMQ